MSLKNYCLDLINVMPKLATYSYPWEAVNDIENIIKDTIEQLDSTYVINEGVAIHNTASVSNTAVIHAPAIIGPGASIGQHTLLRGGIYIGDNTHIGQGVEVKHSLIGSSSALAHFNYVGDSILGSHINLEAGSIVANHYNERIGKTIEVIWQEEVIDTGIIKFGALIGDDSKLGANSVTTPGTILAPRSIVKRLELINQIEGYLLPEKF